MRYQSLELDIMGLHCHPHELSPVPSILMKDIMIMQQLFCLSLGDNLWIMV